MSDATTVGNDTGDIEAGETLMEIDNVSKYFSSGSGFLSGFFGSPDVKAVDDVSFEIKKGETIAVVGESGCGKSTLARTVLQLLRPTAGSVRYKGQDLTELSDKEIRPLRQNMQMIFQDPQSSLNPRMKIGQIVEEPMKAHGLYDSEGRTERAKVLLNKVGLDPSHYNRYPHEFSGGQRQRVNLARALSTDPDLIMCDEPVSALDVSIQAQVLNTMQELQDEFGVTYLFISHDLSVVRYIADRVAVMYLGQIAELADKEELFENPKHPYTEALLDAIPVPDPRATNARGTLEGDVPSPINPPSGCRFRTRCPKVIQPGALGKEPTDLPDEVQAARLQSYELEPAVWQDTLAFTRAVNRRSFVLDEGESDQTEISLPPEEVRTRLESLFFKNGWPEGEVERTINAAIDSLSNGEWEDAATLLSNTFEENSICAIEQPTYTVAPERGDIHVVNCHLHR